MQYFYLYFLFCTSSYFFPFYTQSLENIMDIFCVWTPNILSSVRLQSILSTQQSSMFYCSLYLHSKSMSTPPRFRSMLHGSWFLMHMQSLMHVHKHTHAQRDAHKQSQSILHWKTTNQLLLMLIANMYIQYKHCGHKFKATMLPSAVNRTSAKQNKTTHSPHLIWFCAGKKNLFSR